MAITAECTTCGRKYQAPDAMAGKRVRCKQCGNIFQVPQADIDSGPDLNAIAELAELEKSFHAIDASMTSGGSGMARAAPGEPFTDAESPPVAPLRTGRTNVRFKFAYAKELDYWTPIVLTVGSLLWLGYQSLTRSETPVLWIKLARLAILILAYSLLIAPLSLAMIRAAGRRYRFQMPIADRWRAFATYLPAWAIGVVMWLVGDGQLIALVLGCLAGVAISTAALWLLFRLQPYEIAPTALFASIGFFLGLGIAGIVMWGLNTLALNIVVATKRPDVVPASPIAQGMAWISQEQQKQLLAARQPRTIRPAPTNNTSLPPTTEPQTPTPPSPSPTEPPISSSPLVKLSKAAPIPPAFDEVIRPLTDSPYIAVRRQVDGNMQIDLWDTRTWEHDGQARFAASSEPGGNKYVLSPDGVYLARIATFPRLSVQVWSFVDQRVAKVLYLDNALGWPELVGFAGTDRLLIRWQRSDACTLQVVQMFSDQPARLIATPFFETIGNTLAVSPDGMLAAITAKVQNIPTVLVYNLETGRQINSAAITSLDPRWPLTPTGMAFSFDNTRLAILFEQSGNALLLCYQIQPSSQNAQLVAEHVYPAGVMPGLDTHNFTGNALAWLPDNSGWLIYGQGVFGPNTGRLVEDLKLPKVQISRVVTPDIVQVVADAAPGSGQKQIALLRLDMQKVSSMVREIDRK
ncbi:hypothetical protein [Fontivita pretiosa]|uniref:hypothetical protein n=1 Tax=Fontivita pretiosa TaxID=2989684 RepID=UPI003D16263A